MKYAIITLGLVLGMVSTAQAENQTSIIFVGNLPASVRSAADQAVRKATWAVAVRSRSGWYTIAGRDQSKRLVEFYADSNGAQGYYRTEIGRQDLSATVTTALTAHLPGFQLKRVQAVGRDAQKVMGYRFEGTGLDAGKNCVYVSPDGKKVFQTKD